MKWAVSLTHFIYTRGKQLGAVIGVRQYPKILQDVEHIRGTARRLAGVLVVECCQDTALIVTPEEAYWLQRGGS